MSVEPIGDLCGVRDHGYRRVRCGGLSVLTIDVECDRGSVELAVCALHLAELQTSSDPNRQARE